MLNIGCVQDPANELQWYYTQHNDCSVIVLGLFEVMTKQCPKYEVPQHLTVH